MLPGPLKRLTAGQREALFLVGVSGMTYDEAARIGGCAVGTIKSRVSRARKALLNELRSSKHQLSAPLPSAQLKWLQSRNAATSANHCQ